MVSVEINNIVNNTNGKTYGNWTIGETIGVSELNVGAGHYGDVVLEALWTANTYSVAYNNNTGTGEMTNSTATYDTASLLTANAFQKTGYTFDGWSTTEDNTGI